MSGELAAILTKWGNPPKDMVDLLPKLSCKACTDSKSKNCDRHKKLKCRECHAWISEAHVHLDYMGHASVRRALIETDENWNWEPVAFTEAGEPLITTSGTGNSTHLRMWIRLTVLGKSVLGVGTCGSNKPEPEKELIGDALRNAAMSLGIGLSLWAKDEWNDLGTSGGSEPQARSSPGQGGGKRDSQPAPRDGAPGNAGAAAQATGSRPPEPPPALSSEQGMAASSDAGDGPTAGDGPSPTDPYIERVNADAELGPTPPGAVRPADMVNLIRALDEQTRADIKEYARSKGYKVTAASLTQVQADDLAAWLDRRP